MKYTHSHIYTVAAAALLILPTAFAFSSCHKKEKKTQETPEIAVAYPMEDSVVLHKSYPGYIRAANSADVMALVNGRILSRNYEEGLTSARGRFCSR